MKGASLIADCLSSQVFCKLEELNVAGNSLGEEGTRILVERGLKGRRSLGLPPLRHLDLSQTHCGVNQVALAIQEGSLTSLRVFENNLGSRGFYSLAHVMREGLPSTLESLDLAGNNADKTSVLQLLESLLHRLTTASRDPSCLKSLVIGGNQGGRVVEELIMRIDSVRPELHIARDKPRKEV